VPRGHACQGDGTFWHTARAKGTVRLGTGARMDPTRDRETARMFRETGDAGPRVVVSRK